MAIGHMSVGHGPRRVIALHGWFGSAHGWGWLPDLIDGDRFTYAFMDYRGYGGRTGVAATALEEFLAS
jgi:pimeloyl-ACP methyl ester carboxylesterase